MDKVKWKSYCIGSEGYQIRLNTEWLSKATTTQELRERLEPIVYQLGGSFETQKLNSNLIVTAVNGCKEVNPSNPLVVAENIKDMVTSLKAVQSDVETYWDTTKLLISANTYALIKETLKKIQSEVK